MPASLVAPGLEPTTEATLPPGQPTPAPKLAQSLGSIYIVGKDKCSFYTTASIENSILTIYINDPDQGNVKAGVKVQNITAAFDPKQPGGTTAPKYEVPWKTTPGGKPITADPVTGVGVADGMFFFDFSGSKDELNNFVPFDVRIVLTIDVMCIDETGKLVKRRSSPPSPSRR